jgi:predicted small secreted protein
VTTAGRYQSEDFAAEMERIAFNGVGSSVTQGGQTMFQKILTVALVAAALGTAACNTVRGAARDVNSVANCTENAINGTKSC